jgi:predicted regulator of Ras-like GTPase activity (Roadblock/LC7/MglB family)
VVIEQRFAEIGAVEGVTASFICDNSGRVIASSFGDDIDITPVRDVARELLQTAAVLDRVGEPARELDFTYAGSRIVVRDLENSLLVVLCKPQVEIAMLRLTLNVAATQLRDDAELRNRLRDNVTDREVLESELDQISWQLMQTLERKEANNA